MNQLFNPAIANDPKAQKLVHRWIAALRSGEYQQGHAMLRSRSNKFCCLGVVCDLVDHAAWSSHTFDASNGGQGFKHPLGSDDAMGSHKSSEEASYYISTEMRRRLRLTPAAVQTLAVYNDGDPVGGEKPRSFKEIADELEVGFRSLVRDPEVTA